MRFAVRPKMSSETIDEKTKKEQKKNKYVYCLLLIYLNFKSVFLLQRTIYITRKEV